MRGRLYSKASWHRARRRQLAAQPCCEKCLEGGVITAAVAVHHRQPLRDAPHLAFDGANLQSLCLVCHNRTAQGAEHRGYSNEIGVDGYPTTRIARTWAAPNIGPARTANKIDLSSFATVGIEVPAGDRHVALDGMVRFLASEKSQNADVEDFSKKIEDNRVLILRRRRDHGDGADEHGVGREHARPACVRSGSRPHLRSRTSLMTSPSFVISSD